VGIEAISRGAHHSHFVESHPNHLSVIRANIEKCGIREKTTLYPLHVVTFLKKAIHRKECFEIIFLDPPYFEDEAQEVLLRPELGEILKDPGLLIIEHFHKRPILKVHPGLSKGKEYRYGDSILSFFRKGP
jgi:16S rRNA G966 N2-methylase RsmD